ncbi:MAG: hypothetical protein LBL66_06510, partial [Clostridiales bacterium]|nr:hypothetical protein [Clostridiales bacterium]
MYIDGRDERQTADNLARAGRIERAFCTDADAECQKDGGESLIGALTSVRDLVSLGAKERLQQQFPQFEKLPFDYNGLSSLLTAIRKYISFYAVAPLPPANTKPVSETANQTAVVALEKIADDLKNIIGRLE